MFPLPDSRRLILCLAALSPWLCDNAKAQCEQAKLVASDGAADAYFSTSVSLDGDIAVLGAPEDAEQGAEAGAVYVYRRQGKTWVEETKLLASDGNAGDFFGTSVSIDGDVIAVGANLVDDTAVDAGAVYLFRWDGVTWVEEDKVQPSDVATKDEFGYEVSVNGSTLVAGSDFDDDLGTSSGSAYVFRWNGSEWLQEAKLLASDGEAGDHFGIVVDVDGDWAVISAESEDELGSNAGAAYVFRHDAGSWSQVTKLLPSDGAAGDGFGGFVGISGDVIVGGSWRDDDVGNNSGSAYVFRWNGTQWVEEQKLTASDGAGNDNFGGYVAVDGDNVIVGAPRNDDAGSNSGSVYVFSWDGGTWNERVKFTASDAETQDLYGFSVTIDGNTVLIGAPDEDTQGGEAGAAYIALLLDHDAQWSNYDVGWPGTGGVPSFTAVGDPRIGDTFTVDLQNSLGSPTDAVILIGTSSASIPTALDGTLLLIPTAVLPVSLPGAGLSVPVNVPCDGALDGITIYAQALELDPGASQGVSFSPGLSLLFGS